MGWVGWSDWGDGVVADVVPGGVIAGWSAVVVDVVRGMWVVSRS